MSGMTRTITIAPVRKTLRVKAGQAHAFEVFTSGLGRWWPLGHGIGPTPRKGVAMETVPIAASIANSRYQQR